MNKPTISVIVPVYNSEQFLASVLESVLAQTSPANEIIVVDDGSTDGSADIIATYGERVRTLRQTNQGQGVARNRGAEASTGSLLAFIDSDDLWDSNKLAIQVALLERFPQAVATYCDYRTIDGHGAVTQTTSAVGTPRPSGNALQQLLIGNCVGSPSVVLVRREAFFQAGGFNEKHSRAAEDYALWLALAVIGPIIYSPDTLVSYRRHAAQTTQDPRFAYNRALGNLDSYDRVAALITGVNNNDTREIYRTRVWEALLTLNWAARRYGDRRVALVSSLRAWRMRPWRMDLLGTLLRSL